MLNDASCFKRQLKQTRVVEQNGQLKRYRNREREILFMNLRQMRSPYEKKYIELTEEDRTKVTTAYHNWQQKGFEETYENVPEFCYSASFDEVKEKGFTLVPSRYIEFVNRDENIDFDTKMKALQTEPVELLVAEEKSKADLLSVFKELGYEIELWHFRKIRPTRRHEKLGKYIRLVDTRNKDLTITNLLGLSIEKKLIPSIANIVGTDLSSYKVVRTSQFA